MLFSSFIYFFLIYSFGYILDEVLFVAAAPRIKSYTLQEVFLLIVRTCVRILKTPIELFLSSWWHVGATHEWCNDLKILIQNL